MEGVKGDLLIVLSQDRYARMQGLVDGIKDVAADILLSNCLYLRTTFMKSVGQWLREPTAV
jgi:hypothetical protein